MIVPVPAPADAIVVAALTKRFHVRVWWGQRREILALDHVSFRVPRGTAFGLLGPNGSGKSTLLRILSTVLLPTTGRAWVGGHSIEQLRQVTALLGVVPAEPRGFAGLVTGRQNLEFFATLQGVPPRTLRPRVAHLLELVELAGLDHQPFWTYSTGQRQRLSLARALLHDPQILLFDEPTKALDPWAAQRTRRWIQEVLIARQGKTLLIASNQLEDIRQLCDHAAVLRRGRLVWQGSSREVLGSLDEAILGTDLVAEGR